MNIDESHLTDATRQSPGIFIWAPLAWSLINAALTGWRNRYGHL